MNTAIQDGFDLGWKLAWVLLGWAREQLLDTYETERRPVGEHNVARSAQPDGAGRDAEESFAWDLAGRVPHLWVDDARTVSTLDLVGPGITHLAGPSAQDGVPRPRGPLAPLVERRLDARIADALGLGPSTASWRSGPTGRSGHRRSSTRTGRVRRGPSPRSPGPELQPAATRRRPGPGKPGWAQGASGWGCRVPRGMLVDDKPTTPRRRNAR